MKLNRDSTSGGEGERAATIQKSIWIEPEEQEIQGLQHFNYSMSAFLPVY